MRPEAHRADAVWWVVQGSQRRPVQGRGSQSEFSRGAPIARNCAKDNLRLIFALQGTSMSCTGQKYAPGAKTCNDILHTSTIFLLITFPISDCTFGSFWGKVIVTLTYYACLYDCALSMVHNVAQDPYCVSTWPGRSTAPAKTCSQERAVEVRHRARGHPTLRRGGRD